MSYEFYKRNRILICGYGSAASYLLDMMLRSETFNNSTIGVMYHNPDKALPRIELSRVAAGIAGNYNQIKTYQCDFTNEFALVEMLNDFNPDIIVYTGRFLSGHKYGSYSYPNGIGYGVWIPMSVAYIYRLMKAVNIYDEAFSDKSKKTIVINTSYPDGVNPWLASVNCSPTTGAGNLNHLVPRIKWSINKISNGKISPYDIKVSLYCSHYANTYISKEGTTNNSPYLLEYFINSDNCNVAKINISNDDIIKNCKDNTASGQVRNIMIATDCYMLCSAFTDKVNKHRIHVPGPLGLIGGYPIIIDTDGTINVIPPQSSNLLDAIKINEDSLRYDGIDSISDGYVTFTDDVIYSMKSIFGIEYPSKLHINDAEEFAKEISSALTYYDKVRGNS